ncbi:unnamed protein product, partial [Rotaria sp. Silwood1]
NFSRLESIEYTIGNCHSHVKDLPWPSTLTHLRIIFDYDGYFDRIQRSLVHLSSLDSLEIYQKEKGTLLPNGQLWGNLIPSSLPLLKIFKYYFQFEYSSQLSNQIEQMSNDQFWNDMSSLDLDDLFSLIDDSNLQTKDNQYFMLDDDMMEEMTSSSSEIDQDQLQTSSPENCSKESSQRSSLECRVCGAPACGMNFDQITCQPCKAFFRRNALRDMSQLKCQQSGSCDINIQTRRLCPYCRLKKCFDIKMRKELILSEEEKKSRYGMKLAKQHKKITDRSNDQKSLAILCKMQRFDYNHILHDDHRILLNNIHNAYQFVVDVHDFSYIERYTSSTPFSQFINDETVVHESLINFFKCIPEFKQLDINDQVLLIKSNFVNIIHLHHMMVHSFQDWTSQREHMSRWISKDFHSQVVRTRRYLLPFMDNPLVLKLALIVFIFNINLSTSSDINQDYHYTSKRIFIEFQNFYTNVLWNYLNYLFDEKEAIKAMLTIVMQILRYQTLMVTMSNSVRQTPDCNRFHSLMQSVFGLTSEID